MLIYCSDYGKYNFYIHNNDMYSINKIHILIVVVHVHVAIRQGSANQIKLITKILKLCDKFNYKLKNYKIYNVIEWCL